MTEIAWAAGIYEGEGTCYMQRRAKGTRSDIATLKVVMTDEDIVRRFGAVVGVGSISGPHADKRKASYKPTWRYIVHGTRARAVLEMFFPWLGERRKAQAIQVFPDLASTNQGE